MSGSTTQPSHEQYLTCGDFHRFFWEFFCHILYHISLPLLRWAACINLQPIFYQKYFNINIEIVWIIEIQWQQIWSYLCNMNNMQRMTLACWDNTEKLLPDTFSWQGYEQLANQNENTCFSQDEMRSLRGKIIWYCMQIFHDYSWHVKIPWYAEYQTFTINLQFTCTWPVSTNSSLIDWLIDWFYSITNTMRCCEK